MCITCRLYSLISNPTLVVWTTRIDYIKIDMKLCSCAVAISLINCFPTPNWEIHQLRTWLFRSKRARIAWGAVSCGLIIAGAGLPSFVPSHSQSSSFVWSTLFYFGGVVCLWIVRGPERTRLFRKWCWRMIHCALTLVNCYGEQN